MKTESLREVKNNLSRVIEELPKTGAVLLPVDDNTDVESLLLSQNPRLWTLIDKSVESGRKRGMTRFEDLPD